MEQFFTQDNRTVILKHYNSPCGKLILGSYGDHLCLCDWITDNNRRKHIDNRILKYLQSIFSPGTSTIIEKVIEELDEYFKGIRTHFDIPLLAVGTDFQKRVWQALLEIPYGSIESYAMLAKRLGCRNSVRAVANAIGSNAISIFIPCHRIIGSNNTLTGYAGGLPAKAHLLNIEKEQSPLKYC